MTTFEPPEPQTDAERLIRDILTRPVETDDDYRNLAELVSEDADGFDDEAIP